jgi:hypothetical protein
VGLTPERWGGYKERVKEVNVVEILGTRVWKWRNETCWNYSKKGCEGQRRMTEGVHLTKIHCKHFHKCHNVPQYNNIW